MLHAHSLLSRILLPVPPPCLHNFRYIRDFLPLLYELTAFIIFCPVEQCHKRLVVVTTLARCVALAQLPAGDRPIERTNITTGLQSLLDKLFGSLAIKYLMQPSNADMTSTDRKGRSCWGNFWCGGYRQAVSDIHNRWRCAGLKFLAFL